MFHTCFSFRPGLSIHTPTQMMSSETSTSSSDDDSFVMEARREYLLLVVRSILAVVMAVVNVFENESSSDYSVDPARPRTDRLGHLLVAHESIFRMNVGFSLGEFEELCSRVCPVLEQCARSTGDVRRGVGRPPKLSSTERVLAAIFYLKHNSTGRYESSHWNYSRSSVFDDSFFVLSVISEIMASEIQWPDAARRRQLGSRIPTLFSDRLFQRNWRLL
jgi:hypothetical protein